MQHLYNQLNLKKLFIIVILLLINVKVFSIHPALDTANVWIRVNDGFAKCPAIGQSAGTAEWYTDDFEVKQFVHMRGLMYAFIEYGYDGSNKTPCSLGLYKHDTIQNLWIKVADEGYTGYRNERKLVTNGKDIFMLTDGFVLQHTTDYVNYPKGWKTISKSPFNPANKIVVEPNGCLGSGAGGTLNFLSNAIRDIAAIGDTIFIAYLNEACAYGPKEQTPIIAKFSINEGIWRVEILPQSPETIDLNNTQIVITDYIAGYFRYFMTDNDPNYSGITFSPGLTQFIPKVPRFISVYDPRVKEWRNISRGPDWSNFINAGWCSCGVIYPSWDRERLILQNQKGTYEWQGDRWEFMNDRVKPIAVATTNGIVYYGGHHSGGLGGGGVFLEDFINANFLIVGNDPDSWSICNDDTYNVHYKPIVSPDDGRSLYAVLEPDNCGQSGTDIRPQYAMHKHVGIFYLKIPNDPDIPQSTRNLHIEAGTYLGASGGDNIAVNVGVSNGYKLFVAGNFAGITGRKRTSYTSTNYNTATSTSRGKIIVVNKSADTIVKSFNLGNNIYSYEIQNWKPFKMVIAGDWGVTLLDSAGAFLWTRPITDYGAAGNEIKADIDDNGTVAVLNKTNGRFYVTSSTGVQRTPGGVSAAASTSVGAKGNFYNTSVGYVEAIAIKNDTVFVGGYNNDNLGGPPDYCGEKNALAVQSCYVRAFVWNGSNYVYSWRLWDIKGDYLGLDQADSRVYNLNIGKDGNLYMLGEQANSNGPFRWDGQTSVELEGYLRNQPCNYGSNYGTAKTVFYDSYTQLFGFCGAVHISYYCRIDTKNQKVERGQFAMAIRTDGCKNSFRVKDYGYIHADAKGFVYFTGASTAYYAGRNIQFINGMKIGKYSGSDGVVAQISPDFKSRIFMVSLNDTSADGNFCGVGMRDNWIAAVGNHKYGKWFTGATKVIDPVYGTTKFQKSWALNTTPFTLKYKPDTIGAKYNAHLAVWYQDVWNHSQDTLEPNPLVSEPVICDSAYFCKADFMTKQIPVPAHIIAHKVAYANVCLGQDVTFTDISICGVSQQWDFGQGASLLPGTTGSGPHIVKYSTPGLKRVVLWETLLSKTYKCTDTLITDMEAKDDYINVLPDTLNISNIKGATTVCESAEEFYSVNAIWGVTKYNWTVPSGAVIVDGQGANQIKVKWGQQSGEITVYAEYACGNTPIKKINVTVSPSGPNKVLFVVGKIPLSAGDQAMKTKIQNMGYVVNEIDDDVAQTANATCVGLVVISRSADSLKVGYKFTRIAVPSIVYNPDLFDETGISYGKGSIYNGTTPNSNTIKIINSNHQLAGGLGNGSHQIYSSTLNGISWCKTGADAIQIATITGNQVQTVVVGYDKNTNLNGGYVAAARRVGLFPDENGVTAFTSKADSLLKYAVCWALNNCQSNNKVTTTAVSKSVICPGETIDINYTATGVFGNIKLYPPIDTFIIDNTTSGYFTTFGDYHNWKTQSTLIGYHGSDYIINNIPGSRKVDERAEYKPNILYNGNYKVYFKYPGNSANDDQVPVWVIDGNGDTNKLFINQKISANFATSVGTFYFKAGTTNRIIIWAYGANENVIWDACKIVPVSTTPQVLKNQFVVQLSNAFGSFAGGITELGSKYDSVSGTISVKVPISIQPGSQYKIRVNSTNPSVTGTVYSGTLVIGDYPYDAGPISGNSKLCVGDKIQTYSVASVPGAKYIWEIPLGATYISPVVTINPPERILTTSNTVTVDFGVSLTNPIKVWIITGCGQSLNPSRLTVEMNYTIPDPVGAIGGDQTLCTNGVYDYVITLVNRASKYEWQYPAWMTIQSSPDTINHITLKVNNGTPNNTTGQIRVRAKNHCGATPWQTLNVKVDNVAGTPVVSNITALNIGGCNNSFRYSISPVNDAISYSWTLPAGATGSSTINSIDVTYPMPVTGNVIASVTNGCGTGTKILPVSISGVMSRAMLYVLNSAALTTHEQSIFNRLKDTLGYTVDVVDYNDTWPSTWSCWKVVVVSAGMAYCPNNADCYIRPELITLTIPIVAMTKDGTNGGSFRSLQMEGYSVNNGDNRVGSHSTTFINITNNNHAITQGLALGNVAVYKTAKNVMWSEAHPNAVDLAKPTSKCAYTYYKPVDSAQIFCFETNTLMWNGTVTSARRVGLFFSDAVNFGTDVTKAGLQIFDKAICWATGKCNYVCNTVISNTITNVSCKGGNNGAINLIVTSGQTPYTFSWSNGKTTQNNTTITAGNYNVTVTDGQSCQATSSFSVTEPNQLILNSAQTNINCFDGNNGAVSISVTGGVTPYTYIWTGGGTTSSISGKTAGNYTVTLTDNKSCTLTSSFSITQPASALSTVGSITHISCFGGSNGVVSLTTSGGTTPYSYSWSTGENTAGITGKTQGSYTVTVTDTKLCTLTSSFSITQPANGLSLTSAITHVSCNAGNNGTVDITVSGGTPAYTYSWSGGGTTATISGKTQGTYTVTVTDTKLCTLTSSFSITQPSNGLSLTSAITHVSCNTGNNGAVDIVVSGGTPTYTYSWSGGGTTATISGKTQGTYTVTVSDTKSCTLTSSFSITQPSNGLSLTSAITHVSCNNGNNGAVAVTISGGTPTYSYSWSGGGTTSTISGKTQGSYNVTVTDTKSCTLTSSFLITQPTNGLSLTSSITHVSCSSGNNGAVDIVVSGGTPAYTYSWSGGGTTAAISGKTQGTYTVTVSDTKSCTLTSSFSITQPANGLSLTSVITHVSCNGGNNGSIEVIVSGGTPVYTYSWSGGETTATISGKTQGSYTVTITDTKSCTLTSSFSITQPANSLSLTSAITHVSCNAGNNGAITVTVSGGTPTYTYSWSGSGSTASISGKSQGNYTVTITDTKFCTLTSSFSITQPTNGLSLTSAITHVNCNTGNNGSVTITISGGTPTYTYSWNGGGTTATISGKTQGTYTVTVTDTKSCTLTSDFTITQPSNGLSLTSAITHVSCNAGNNGSVDVIVSGGTPVYTYSWSGGGITATISGKTQGNYTVTVTDTKLCTLTSSFSVTQPAILSMTGSLTNISCNGSNNGSVLVTVFGGTSPYNYTWSSGESTNSIASKSNGTYAVTVSDMKSCSLTGTFSLTQPSLLTLSGSITHLTAYGSNNGQINLTLGGGTPGYTYSWSNGSSVKDQNSLLRGIYNVTVKDNNSCSITGSYNVTEPGAINITGSLTHVKCNGGNSGIIDISVTGGNTPYNFSWSSGSALEDISGLPANTYTVTVTDASSSTSLMNFVITQPASILISSQKTDVSCNGGNTGAINITVTGGAGSNSYNWSNGQNFEDIGSLVNGNYTVTVTDINSCSHTANFNITQPTVLTLNGTVTHVTVFGGNDGGINITVIGGSPSYTYSWSNNSSIEDLNSITSGNYTVTVIDTKGCSITGSFNISQPGEIIISGIVTNVLCNSNSTGAINVTTTGGAAPYSFSWSNTSNVEDLSNIPAGNYTLTVTDANSISKSMSFAVTQPAALSISSQKTDVACNGGNTGAINITVIGGAGSNGYNWSNGQSSKDIGSLINGNYSLTVTDINSCTISASYAITQPTVLTLNGSVTHITAFGANDGKINVTVSGGKTSYVYSWSNGTATQNQIALAKGIYQLTVSDNNACSITGSYNISEPGSINISSITTHVSCNAGSDGSIDITINGGNKPYSVLWSNSSTDSLITNLSAGNYTVTVTDNNTVSSTLVVSVTEPAAISVSNTITHVNCNGGNSGVINISVTGGTSSYTYSWSNGQISEDIGGLVKSDYTLTVSDSKGCTKTSSYSITEPLSLNLSGTVTNISCHNQANGVIDISVTGGKTSYTYLWNNGKTTAKIDNLLSGSYAVTVSDQYSCTIIGSWLITEPTNISVTATLSHISIQGANNGEIKTSVIGGNGSYSYIWSNSDITQNINNLYKGVYTVTVTDNGMCTATASWELTEPGSLNVQIVSATNITCFGGNNGAIDVNVSGGVSPYTYLWNTTQPSKDINSLTEGFYAITVTDAASATATANYVITQPQDIVLVANKTNTSCNGASDGIIEINISGGTSPFNYSWSNANTNKTINNLSPGIYSITVTDFNGCTKKTSAIISQPNTLSVSVNPVEINCYNRATGIINIIPTGGTPVYSYSWSDGTTYQNATQKVAGTYSVIVTDKNNCTATASYTLTNPSEITLTYVKTEQTCSGINDGAIDITVSGGSPSYTYNWSNGATVDDLNALDAGAYLIQINDTKGCSKTDLIFINPGAVLNVVPSISNVTCSGRNDGAISLNVNGGTTSYSYSWSNATDTDIITNLTSGNYSYTVNDAKGCTVSDTITINESQKADVLTFISNVQCYGKSDGRIVLSVDAHGENYQVNWFGRTETGLELLDIPAGEYQAEVIVGFGCKDTLIVQITQPDSIHLESTINKPYCEITGNGKIEVQTTGGNAPYSYKWNNNVVGNFIDNITVGVYLLTVTDMNGCTKLSAYNLKSTKTECVEIPTAFSPNNDGINDVWDIKQLKEIYPNVSISIFNRWGEIVYASKGYTQPWDGTFKGKSLPFDSYHYIIEFNDGSKPKMGQVTIIK